MSTTKVHSTCRIANIGPDDAMILAHAANPDGSNFRKGHGIFSLYRHHLDLLKVPFSFVETGYFSLPDDKRIEALQTIFAQREKDPKVVSLVPIFQVCLDVRNKLAHAEFYPISFLGKKPGYWHLTKRISKKNPDRGYMQIELSALRDMADKVAYGTKHCASLVIYLRVRDIPRSQRPRAYQEYEDEPLPLLSH
jgi:hypothetical protein